MKRSTIIALAAFGLLALAYLASREERITVGVKKLELPVVPADKVNRVAVGGAFKAVLEKNGTAWTVADPAKPEARFPADEVQVNSLLKALAELKAPDLVTERAEKHGEFELDEAKALQVSVQGDSGQKLELWIGKQAKVGGAYVRKAGSDAVFVSTSPVTYQLKKTVNNWRKKAVSTVPLAELTRVAVAPASGAPLAIVRGEGDTWVLEGELPPGFRFDAAAAGRWAQQFSAISAQEFGAEGETDDFSAPTVIQGSDKDGKVVKVSLGAKRASGTYPVRVEADAQTYLVSQWQVDGLVKKLDDLRDLSLVAFDPEKATKLEIVAAGRKTLVVKEGSDWKLVEPIKQPDGFEFDAQTVLSQLGRLKAARGLRVLSGVAESKTGLAAPSTTVTVALEGGGVQQLRFGAAIEGSSDVYVKGSADGLTYAAAAGEKTSWERGVDLFKRQPPPDFGGMRGLEQLPPEIRKQLEAQLRQRPH